MTLSRNFGLSRRQAYRYLEEAQLDGPPSAPAEASITITLKMPAESGPRPACTCDAFRNDNQRDRATCYLRLSVGNPRAWLSGREFDALSVSNIRSIVCSPRSLSKPTRFSILIRCGSFAPVLM